MRVFFTNLGCKLNQAELERAARQFSAAGHDVVGSIDEADFHIVNTCTVTHVAARTSRKVARRSQRQRPGIKTVLTGCWVAEATEEAAQLAGVDLVVGNHEKEHLVERIHARFPSARPRLPPLPEPLPVTHPELGDSPYMPLAWGHSRAAVKIEDGCNVDCAFCIIPTTRGRQRSRSPLEVLEEIQHLVDRGGEEIVLTGVQISHYRSEGTDLYALVCRILDETDLRRLRLTSIAPWRFDRRLFRLFASASSGRLCRHFHLSLQSGCTETLRRMRRPYTAKRYEDLVGEIREAVPGIALTTDVIVGFPGETAEEFEESLQFVERMEFAKVHAFPYSPRPGTPAASMKNPVSSEEKRSRMGRILEVAEHSTASFQRAQIGQELEVLWERHRKRQERWGWEGTTDNYVPVWLEDGAVSSAPRGVGDLAGRLATARLDRVEAGMVRASWPRTTESAG